MPFSVREGMNNIYKVIDGYSFLPFFLSFFFLYSVSLSLSLSLSPSLFCTALLVILDSITHMSAVSAIINIIKI